MKQIRNLIAILGSFLFLMGTWATAYADEYRVTETRADEFNSQIYDYDADGKLIRKRCYFGEDPWATINYIYANDGTLTEEIYTEDDYYGGGRILYCHYDSNGTTIEKIYSLTGSEISSTTYEVITEVRDEAGRTVMLKQEFEPMPDETKVYYYVYDDQGRISMYEVSGRRRDVFTYYNDGRFIRTSTMLKDNSSFVSEEYDSSGRRLILRDETGSTTYYHYDKNGLLSYEEDEHGELRCSYRYVFDENGNVSEEIREDADGNEVQRTEYQYEKIQ